MKTTKKHFSEFKKWCEYYIDKFKLDDFRIDIIHEDIRDEEAFAQARYRTEARVASLVLNTDIDLDNKLVTKDYIKLSAKHECIHLILSDLDVEASARFTTEGRLIQANERVVRKLEKLL